MKLLNSNFFLLFLFMSGCSKEPDASMIVHPNDIGGTNSIPPITRDTEIKRFTVSDKTLLECLNILIDISDPSLEMDKRLIYVWRTREDVEAPPTISLDARNITISQLFDAFGRLTNASWSIRTLDSGEITAIIIGFDSPGDFRPREIQSVFADPE